MTKKRLENILAGCNNLKKVKVRFNVIKNGYSLYLEMNKNGKRTRKFLDVYLSSNPQQKAENENKLRLVFAIQQKNESQILQNKAFDLASEKDVYFLEYLAKLAANRDALRISKGQKKEQNRNWWVVYRRIKDFLGKDCLIQNVTNKMLIDFKKTLDGSDESTKTSKGLKKAIAANTMQTYFRVLKTCFNSAIADGLINKSPATGITIKVAQKPREFLNEDELRKLVLTPCSSTQIRNAFIFSCCTGLRISDLRNLKFQEISSNTQNSNFINISQEKTGEIASLKLNDDANKVLAEQKELQGKSKFVFKIPYSNYISQVMRLWVANSGIKKHITFHCARHTFATLLLSKGVDIYTVSRLLGHSSIKPTQIYAHLVDRVKDAAIDALPKLNL